MLERLHQLEININELKKFQKDITLDELKNVLQKQWSLRYGLFESIQIIIDIACHLVSKYNLGNPKTYNECIDLLLKFDYIEKNLADKLIPMIGLRNLLIHEYVQIEIEKLYSSLNHLEDFNEFAKSVKDYL